MWNDSPSLHSLTLHSPHTSQIKMSILFLIEGMFAAGTVMVSFGAMLGKITLQQLFFLSIFEVFFYSVNFFVCSLELKAIDMGGR